MHGSFGDCSRTAREEGRATASLSGHRRCSLWLRRRCRTQGLDVVLLDGTWRQANMLLHHLGTTLLREGVPLPPRVKLSPTTLSNFRARTQTQVPIQSRFLCPFSPL